MMRAPEKKRREVPMTEPGVAIGVAIGAAMSVENKHGKKR
jgi:hypothetical protein